MTPPGREGETETAATYPGALLEQGVHSAGPAGHLDRVCGLRGRGGRA